MRNLLLRSAQTGDIEPVVKYKAPRTDADKNAGPHSPYYSGGGSD